MQVSGIFPHCGAACQPAGLITTRWTRYTSPRPSQSRGAEFGGRGQWWWRGRGGGWGGGGRRKERGGVAGGRYGVAHARGDGVEVERRTVYFLVHLCLFYSVVALLLWFVVDEGVCGGGRGEQASERSMGRHGGLGVGIGLHIVGNVLFGQRETSLDGT